MICCGCGKTGSFGAEGWLSLPSTRVGVSWDMRHACPDCGKKAHDLAVQIEQVLHTDDVSLFALVSPGMLHPVDADPLVDPDKARAEVKDSSFAWCLGPDPSDTPRVEFVMTAHRFTCGCGKCDYMHFRLPAELDPLGSMAKISPSDVGMRLHDGEAFRVVFERVPPGEAAGAAAGADVLEYDNKAYLELVRALKELMKTPSRQAIERTEAALAASRIEEVANEARHAHNLILLRQGRPS